MKKQRNSEIIVCGTGHRPEDSEREKIVRVKARVKLGKSPVDTYICGMAAGFDLWSGDEARLLGIPLVCAVPWRGHQPRKGDEELYQRLLDAAVRVHYVSERMSYPGAFIYPERNHWMVDNSEAVMAYWSGKQKGGTYECVTYARKQKKKIANIYNDAPF